MESKAQTALEYLLIVMIAIVVVVAVFIFMQSAGESSRDIAAERSNKIVCEMKDCENDTVCNTYPPCQGIGTVNCVSGFCKVQ
jgi:uncharacterized protein (UPF0333 family)